MDDKAEYEEYLHRLAGLHAHEKSNWGDSIPKYKDYIWLIKERHGYFCFWKDAEEVAALCGCQLRQYKPPMGKTVPFVFIPYGDDLENVLDALDENPRGLLLLKYEGPIGDSSIVFLPVNPIVRQASLFD